MELTGRIARGNRLVYAFLIEGADHLSELLYYFCSVAQPVCLSLFYEDVEGGVVCEFF